MTNASILTHTDFKVKSHGAGAYCGGHLAAQLVIIAFFLFFCISRGPCNNWDNLGHIKHVDDDDEQANDMSMQ